MTDPIKTVEEFIAWTKGLQGGLILYRGLPDADWEVESSAYRRIEKSKIYRLRQYLQLLSRTILINYWTRLVYAAFGNDGTGVFPT